MKKTDERDLITLAQLNAVMRPVTAMTVKRILAPYIQLLFIGKTKLESPNEYPIFYTRYYSIQVECDRMNKKLYPFLKSHKKFNTFLQMVNDFVVYLDLHYIDQNTNNKKVLGDKCYKHAKVLNQYFKLGL